MMSEFRRDHVPPRPTNPTADEHLWRVRKDGHTLHAALRCHGYSYGVELQIFCDGAVLFGRRYDHRELATAEAHALLQRYRGEGWAAPPKRRAAG
jgi:hypothetical protein